MFWCWRKKKGIGQLSPEPHSYYTAEDILARKTYAEKIATEISNHYEFNRNKEKKDRENIIFAISAKWGEGKTTLLSFLETPLRQKGFQKIIKFNPWKYSQEDLSLKRAFLCAINDQLECKLNLDDLYFDRAKTILIDNWKSTVFLISLVLLIVPLTIVYTLAILKFLKNDLFQGWLNIIIEATKKFLASTFMTAAATAAIIVFLIKIMTLNVRSANVSTAEQFEKKFDELIGDKKKVVVFIDDLDRCSPRTVKVILDSLKTFFQHPECSYVITGDHTVIERYAGKELGLTQDLEEGRRFIKKLFDVYWRLPLPTPYRFSNFIDCEINNSKIEISEQQSTNLKSFLRDDALFERNLRNVKRFLTKLRFALESVKLQRKEIEEIETEVDSKIILNDILQTPDLLAKVLLIEEFFYPMYEELILHPEELVIHEKHLRSGGKLEELKVADKTALSIFDKKNEKLASYVSFVKKSPKFTDEDNEILHEVASYFSFSGSTGLPSLIGPDDAKFEEYIKTGQLADKLGASIEQSTREKNIKWSSAAIKLFNETNEPTEKQKIARDALRLALRRDEWAAKLSDWLEKLTTLDEEPRNLLARDFLLAVLQKKPELLPDVKKKNQKYFDSIWILLKEEEMIKKPNSGVVSALIKIIKEEINTEPEDLKNAEMYLQIAGFDSKEIKAEIDKKLVDPDTCRKYIKHMEEIGFSESKVSGIAIKKLQNFLSSFDNLEWVNKNQKFLKSLKMFDATREKLIASIKSLKELIEIADNLNILKPTDDEKKLLVKLILEFIKESVNVQYLNNNNLQAILDKDTKIILFQQLQDVLKNPDEFMDKRREAVQMLKKDSSLWSGIEMNDIYSLLKGVKEIKKLKADKNGELINKLKEILNSWGYVESSDIIARKRLI